MGGNTYYQLVKNERVAGKHRQQVLMHLGQHASVEAAMEAWAKRARSYRSMRKQSFNERAEALEEKVKRLMSLSGD